MNTNDLNRSLALKGTRNYYSSLQDMDLTKAFDHCRGPLVIKKLNGTGVPLINFTAFLRLGEFAARTDAAA